MSMCKIEGEFVRLRVRACVHACMGVCVGLDVCVRNPARICIVAKRSIGNLFSMIYQGNLLLFS